MDQTLVFDPELIARYDQSGPRYTSYPTAVQFHEGFGPAEYRQAVLDSNAEGRPLSLYFHLPFCDTVCFYCACNKVATKDRSRSQPYLDRVYRELAMQGELFDSDRPVEQLHWGGGTPTFISSGQMRELMSVTGRHFQLLDDDTGEYSIEIDPREVTDATIGLLREIGFKLTFGHLLKSPEPLDIEHTDCLVLLGSHLGENMHNTQVQDLADAVGKGAQLVVVDPRFSTAAGKARYWLPIKPGTDMALLLAWMHVLIEEELYDKAYVEQHAIGFEQQTSSVGEVLAHFPTVSGD